jgi:CRP-like cAMP-binding protein
MYRPNNNFFSALSDSDFDLLSPDLRPSELKLNAVLFDHGQSINRIYFPESGIVSLVVVLTNGELIEAGIIGRDGVVGASGALDGGKSLNRALVQTAGQAFSIDVGKIKNAVMRSASLRQTLYRFDQLLLLQAQQAAACNAIHTIPQRLCRWILRAHDVLQTEELHLTQEFLSQMLGVRRTSVTVTALNLQNAKLIKYRRGRIRIIDLEGLKAASCECHEAVKAQKKMLLESNPEHGRRDARATLE